MHISVALCTYNGALHLDAQLQSIAAGRRLPDELVVHDDGSTDATPQILRDFAAAAPFPVRLALHEANAGLAANFERAISDCTGDVIVLTDQDDVWLPAKLSSIAAVFSAVPGAGLVFSDADFIDANGNALPGHLWECNNFTPAKFREVRRGRAFDVLLQHNVVTGATMALRADLRELLLPIPAGQALIHDAWMALLLAAVAPVVAIQEHLIGYRQHGAQHTRDIARQPGREWQSRFYADYLRQLEAAQERLVGWSARHGVNGLDRELRLLREKISHIERRASLPPSRLRRLPAVLGELLSRRYHRYSNGFASAARDLLM